MLLHFDFEPDIPTWREFQRALESISGRDVSMTGGPGPSGGPEVWVAKAGGLKGKLILEYQADHEHGLVIHASEAHREFVAPLVEALGGTRRAPSIEARSDGRGLDYSNGPNPYDEEWLEFASERSFFRLDIGYFYLLFDDSAGLVARISELEADEPSQTLVLDAADMLELRSALEAAAIEASADKYLAEDLDYCRRDLSAWFEAQRGANAMLTVTRHY